MKTKAMEATKRTGGQQPTKVARRNPEQMKASSPKKRGTEGTCDFSYGKIPNK